MRNRCTCTCCGQDLLGKQILAEIVTNHFLGQIKTLQKRREGLLAETAIRAVDAGQLADFEVDQSLADCNAMSFTKD